MRVFTDPLHGLIRVPSALMTLVQSEAVQRFEDRLGVRLFERTTRSVALTPAGEQLYMRSLPAITDLEAALRELDEQKDAVAGTLRLSAPYSAGAFFLDDIVSVFAARYPEVKVELIYDDQKVDLVESGIDAAIRSRTLLESETIAYKLKKQACTINERSKQ